jgi:L-aspartate oxidase
MPVTNVLIIGSGLAGLSVAIRLAEKFPDKQILIFNKSNFRNSNSYLAQGGLAVAVDKTNDSFEKHIQDTLDTGAGLCNEEVVRYIINNANEALQKLQDWGVKFDFNEQGNLNLGLEGAHSANRIVHSGDNTGQQIINALINEIKKYPNIILTENCFAIDLLISPEGDCTGADFICNGNYFTVEAEYTVLAGGGTGQIYQRTSNPATATGDAIAMAQKAGAKIDAMEFIQFHPTIFYNDKNNNSFLITEALRGEGAFIVNESGHRFLFEYDERGELASRDIVSKAIFSELIQSNKKNVFIDCRHLPEKLMKEHFSGFFTRCANEGMNPLSDKIPVAPGAHYCCGGITTNLSAQTSVPGLFALGECAYTGLHGANRLASNSLTEAMVLSKNCADKIQETGFIFNVKTRPDEFYFAPAEMNPVSEKIKDLKNKLKTESEISIGVVRNNSTLTIFQKHLQQYLSDISYLPKNEIENIEYHEFKNMLLVANLVAEYSILRSKSVGCFNKT